MCSWPHGDDLETAHCLILSFDAFNRLIYLMGSHSNMTMVSRSREKGDPHRLVLVALLADNLDTSLGMRLLALSLCCEVVLLALEELRSGE